MSAVMEPIPVQIPHETCTICKNATQILLRGQLLVEPPYLPFRICGPCFDFWKPLTGELRVTWNQQMWEQAALDLGDPEGSGLERRAKAPRGALFTPPNEPCSACDRFIGDEPFHRGNFFAGQMLPFILCDACSVASTAMPDGSDEIKALANRILDKALLIHGRVGGNG